MSARDPAIASPAAGFWHRYAAWSLDAAVLLAAVLWLAWPRVRTAWSTLGAAARDLVSTVGEVLADAMLAGTRLPEISAGLLHEPRLHAAAAMLQHALWQLAWPLLLGYALLAAPWHVFGEASRWQGSPGKRALGLAVTGRDGTRVSFGRAVLRHAAGLLSWLTLNLGHLMAALPPRREALHDRIAGARVLHVRGQARLPGWARAWLLVQVFAAFALLGWLLLRYVAELEAGLPLP